MRCRQHHLTMLAVLVFQLASCYEKKGALCVLSLKDVKAKNEGHCKDLNCTFVGFKDLALDSLHEKFSAVDIYLCSAEYNTSDLFLMKFANFQEIAITGLGEYRSMFNCQNEESGLQFQNISTIDINGITLNQCGSEADVNIVFGIHIANSTNIRMSYVMIQNSPGIGLALVNNSGYINITDCHLDHNNASDSTKLGAGGGILIESGSQSNYYIHNCQFTKNSAKCGGGMRVSFGAGAQNSSMTIIDSRFIGNQAENGGALYISFNRSAGNVQQSQVTFFNSTWMNNTAMYGSALIIMPSASWNYGSVFPTVLFHDCKFIDNAFKKTRKHFPAHYSIDHYGIGTVYVSTFAISLRGQIDFVNNTKSAIYLLSSELVVSAYSSILFKSNRGYQGGAIHMNAFSSIKFNDNTTVVFVNNTAFDRGAAIIHVAPFDYLHLNMDTCFLKYAGTEDVERRNISVMFDNNQILSNFTTQRESVFLYSMQPCYNTYQMKSVEFLHKIASVTFAQDDDIMATFASDLRALNLPDTLIPGIEEQLVISLVDSPNVTVLPPVYKVQVIPHNHSNCISLDQAYTVITNSKIRLYGHPGCGGEIQLTLVNKPDTSLSFNITLRDCPAGYVFIKKKTICQCSANTVNSLFVGIHRCNHTSNQASLVHGYWAGYVGGSEMGQFRTSACPLGYCTNVKKNTAEISLPHCTRSNLSNLLCSKNRFGVICSQCKNQTSVYYHPTYECLEEKNCSVGIIFFMLSQLLPVTILFLAVIVCNIQMTTGELNGFIFYVQIFSTLSLSGDNFIVFRSGTKVLLTILNFIVSFFNLKFFNISKLSFCLYKEATSLDVMAFDYITVVYSLLLIILTVILLNLKCHRVNKCLQKLNKKETHFSQSIIHGLSGFLVLCYARTTTTTLKILTPVWLHDEGPHRVETRVFYYAEMKYFKGDHLKYAIPALFALIFITLLPPMLLLVYPLCYKVLTLLRLEESTASKILCTAVPLERFKPFFDSFQGAFKDNYRYFAGLYFVYRLSTLIIFAFTANLTDFYFYLGIQLIIMLALHTWVQPYKRSSHNKIDLYIFTLLLILNGITFYNYQLTLNQIDKQHIVEAFSTIQVLLAYSPVMVMIIMILRKLRVKAFIKQQRDKYSRKKEGDLTLSLSTLEEIRQLEYSEAYYQKV